MYNNELYHFGVKGMKWGRRNSSRVSSTAAKKKPLTKKQKLVRKEKRLNTIHNVGGVVHMISQGGDILKGLDKKGIIKLDPKTKVAINAIAVTGHGYHAWAMGGAVKRQAKSQSEGINKYTVMAGAYSAYRVINTIGGMKMNGASSFGLGPVDNMINKQVNKYTTNTSGGGQQYWRGKRV